MCNLINIHTYIQSRVLIGVEWNRCFTKKIPVQIFLRKKNICRPVAYPVTFQPVIAALLGPAGCDVAIRVRTPGVYYTNSGS